MTSEKLEPSAASLEKARAVVEADRSFHHGGFDYEKLVSNVALALDTAEAARASAEATERKYLDELIAIGELALKHNGFGGTTLEQVRCALAEITRRREDALKRNTDLPVKYGRDHHGRTTLQELLDADVCTDPDCHGESVCGKPKYIERSASPSCSWCGMVGVQHIDPCETTAPPATPETRCNDDICFRRESACPAYCHCACHVPAPATAETEEEKA